jgi:hypothetical protein
VDGNAQARIQRRRGEQQGHTPIGDRERIHGDCAARPDRPERTKDKSRGCEADVSTSTKAREALAGFHKARGLAPHAIMTMICCGAGTTALGRGARGGGKSALAAAGNR